MKSLYSCSKKKAEGFPKNEKVDTSFEKLKKFFIRIKVIYISSKYEIGRQYSELRADISLRMTRGIDYLDYYNEKYSLDTIFFASLCLEGLSMVFFFLKRIKPIVHAIWVRDTQPVARALSARDVSLAWGRSACIKRALFESMEAILDNLITLHTFIVLKDYILFNLLFYIIFVLACFLKGFFIGFSSTRVEFSFWFMIFIFTLFCYDRLIIFLL